MARRDEGPSEDPFEGLVLDDAFVAAARIQESRVVDRRPRRVLRWAGLAVQTVVVLVTAAVVVASSPTGLGSTVPPAAAAPHPPGVQPTGGVDVPEPWNDPVPELDVPVGPDWLAVGPPTSG